MATCLSLGHSLLGSWETGRFLSVEEAGLQLLGSAESTVTKSENIFRDQQLATHVVKRLRDKTLPHALELLFKDGF
jgi:hypothetical protein